MISRQVVVVVEMHHKYLHWVNMSGRHFGEEREGTSEENDRSHDFL
jgi:hypothetical protein